QHSQSRRVPPTRRGASRPPRIVETLTCRAPRGVPSEGHAAPEPRSWVLMDWRHRAARQAEGPEPFFPIGPIGPALLQIEEAKAVCRRCEVVDLCLQWALETGQDAGVWGGMSEDERRALKRRAARSRARVI